MFGPLKTIGHGFRRVGPNHAATPDFSVSFEDRGRLRYCEGDRAMEIIVDATAHPLVVYAFSISQWLSPFAGEIVTPDKKQEIVARIRLAMRFLDIACDFDFEYERPVA